MKLKNREDAGTLLAAKLKKYITENDYVYALPKGGVKIAKPITNLLHAPLGLLFVRKIGSPRDGEYAIAAVTENTQILGSKKLLKSISETWLWERIDEEVAEIKRQREHYLKGQVPPFAKGGIVILVDDGIATGLTVQAAVSEIKLQEPRKILVAVPIITESAMKVIANVVDRGIALKIIPDKDFKGSIGSYYQDFRQVSDKEVIAILRKHEKEQMTSDIQDVLRNIVRC
ncbi:phosphoribosyltransferase [soil metagenome]